MAKRGKRRRHRQAEQIAENPGVESDAKRIKTKDSTKEGDDTNVSSHVNRRRLVVSSHGKDADQQVIPSPMDIYKNDEVEILKLWKYLGKKIHNKNNQPPQQSSSPSKNNNIEDNEKDPNWEPTLVQTQLWPLLLQSIPTIAIAPTGSGKTLAYGIPTILQSSPSLKNQKNIGGGILVLVPTRELVCQVAKVYSKVVKAYARKLQNESNGRPFFRIVSVYGGVSRNDQVRELTKSTSNSDTNEKLIVVASPGRLLDLLDNYLPTNKGEREQDKEKTAGAVFPCKLDWIILDEADQLAKDGDLGPQVDQILNKTQSKATKLALVSATYPDKARSKFQEWVGRRGHVDGGDGTDGQEVTKNNNYVLVQVDQLLPIAKASTSRGNNDGSGSDAGDHGTESSTALTHAKQGSFARIPSHLSQVLHVCSEHKKARKLLNTLQTVRKNQQNTRNWPLGIVFFSKIEKLKYVSKLLSKEKVIAANSIELHSQLPTPVRQANLHKFSVGQRPLLLATDVAARGIDIPSVKFVIQYDFPGNIQQYIHRCGRAGRSGEPGTIYSFFTRNLKPLAADMIQLLEASNAWVDPNLKELLPQSGGKGNMKNNSSKKKPKNDAPKTSKQGKPENPSNKSKKESAPSSKASVQKIDNFDDDDDFPELSANRILLKRASHVSDASSSDESDNDDEA